VSFSHWSAWNRLRDEPFFAGPIRSCLHEDKGINWGAGTLLMASDPGEEEAQRRSEEAPWYYTRIKILRKTGGMGGY